MAKQGASYEDIIKTEGEEGEEQENNHGNTRLPFGLCARYGIPLPEGATPRDAWEALKGKGVYPPWTEEGKDQYDGDDSIVDDTNKIVDDGVKISPTRKAVYDDISDKLQFSGFSKEYQNSISDVLSQLTDAEISVFASTNYVDIEKLDSGIEHCNINGDMLSVYDNVKSPIDEELGIGAGMTAFGHEYGHAVDAAYSKKNGGAGRLLADGTISSLPECQEAYDKDILEFIGLACDEANVQRPKSLNKLYRPQIVATLERLTALSKEDEIKLKSINDFVKSPPNPPFLSYRSDEEIKKDNYWLARINGWSEEQAEFEYKQVIADRDEQAKLHQEAVNKYEKDKKEYEGYLKTKEYSEGLKKYEEYKTTYNESKQKNRATLERFGLISDCVGEITNGRVDVYRHGFYGHTVNYYQTRSSGKGQETWATYFGMKTNRDTKGLEMMKRHLPNTYKVFEEKYSGLSESLKSKRRAYGSRRFA